MSYSKIIGLFPFVNLFVFAGPSFAENEETFEFKWENDTFLNEVLGIGDYNDRHYTNGIWLNFLYGDNEISAKYEKGEFRSADIMRAIWPLGMDIERTRGGWTLAHQFYTPEIISTDISFLVGTARNAASLQVNDRPYAGYAFIEPRGERRGEASFFGLTRLPARDRFGVAFGFVGPGAGAKELQSEWHRLLSGPRPDGWSHQLNNEPTLNLHAERTWMWSSDDGSQNPYFDVMPKVGLDLGNVSTRLSIGLEGRWGFGQIHDFHLPSMSRAPEEFGIYLQAAAEGWFIGHDIFLDGNTFTNSHSVDKEYFVSELRLGLGINCSWGKFETAWVRRSEEFELQREADTYLSSSFTWRF